MITKLNLASRPFRNRTLPYLIALLLLGCALAGTIISFTLWREVHAKNEITGADIEKMQTDLEKAEAKAEEIRQSLTPAQQELLIAGHKLVANKEFGWSWLLSDLERVLPGSVSASRINVENIYKENGRLKAELEFAVLAQNYQGVLQMIENMNNSGKFRASLRGQDRQNGETITYSEYTLHLIYMPNQTYSPTIPGDVASNVQPQGGAN